MMMRIASIVVLVLRLLLRARKCRLLGVLWLDFLFLDRFGLSG